jgi:predicted transposase YdaD
MPSKTEHFTKTFRCLCNSPEHQFIVEYWNELPEEKETYIYVLLTKIPFYSRIWVALCYLFGRRSQYGAFEEVVLSAEQTRELYSILKTRVEELDKL